MSLLVQLGDGAGLQFTQLVLIDHMVADHAMLAAVPQLHVEEERLEQIISLQRCVEGVTGAISFIQLAQHFADPLYIGRRTTSLVEEQNSLSATGDPRMLHIDMNLAWAVPRSRT